MVIEYVAGHPKEAGALLIVLSGLTLLLFGLLASSDRAVHYRLGVKIEIDQMAPGKKRAFELVGALLLVAGLLLLFFLVDRTGAPGTPTVVSAETATPSSPGPEPSLSTTPSATATTSPGRVAVGLRDGDTVGRHTVVTGTCASDVTGDIWVLVRPDNGLYYPQSTDACAGEHTTRLHGRWQVPAVFGEAGDGGARFEVVVVTADAKASAFLADTVSQWCRQQDYPGLASLPGGAAVVSRTSVVRSAEATSPPKGISGVHLAGSVMVNSLKDGDSVPESLVIAGTVSAETAGTVWVLVYPYDAGRWYPQSTDACAGVHTEYEGESWRVKAWFGSGAGSEYSLAVVLADAAADARLSTLQEEWCAAGRYPGLRPVELPLGLEEKAIVMLRGR